MSASCEDDYLSRVGIVRASCDEDAPVATDRDTDDVVQLSPIAGDNRDRRHVTVGRRTENTDLCRV